MSGRRFERHAPAVAAKGVWVVAAALAVATTTTARAYQPLPWDVPTGAEPVYHRPDRDAPVTRSYAGRRELFGTTGAFLDYSVTFDGHIPGIAQGRGYTFEMPATLPGWLIYALLVNPGAVFSALTPEAWTSGFRGEGVRTSPVFDEIDFELLYSISSHDDRLAGGDVDYTRVGLGVRVSGPAPRDRILRGSLLAGWTWHDLDFDLRRDLTASGPYLGLGLETRFARDPSRTSGSSGRDSMTSIRLSARWEFVRGLDGAGDDFDATVFTGGAGFSFYW